MLWNNFLFFNAMEVFTKDTEKEFYRFRDDVYELTVADDVSEIPPLAFIASPHLEVVHIPDSVKEIGVRAFENCGLRSIRLPSGLQSIRRGLFDSCNLLEKVELPQELLCIEEDSFRNCTSLVEICLPEGLLEIREGAFAGCCSLTRLVLPTSLCEIRGNPFGTIDGRHFCRSSMDIINKSPYFDFEDGILYDKCHTRIIHCFKQMEELHISASVKKINGWAFCGQSLLQRIAIPDNVVEIGQGAICGCEGVECVILPNSLRKVSDYLFACCTSLRHVEWHCVKLIGYSAFWGCIALETISLPNGLCGLGRSAFQFCKGLKSIVLPNGISKVGEDTFQGCISLESVKFSTRLTEIKDSAFDSCVNMLKVDFPDTLEKIGMRAFKGCTSLTELQIPGRVQFIGFEAFYGCKNLARLSFSEKICKIEVKDAAFANHSNQFVVINSCRLDISEKAFIPNYSLSKFFY